MDPGPGPAVSWVLPRTATMLKVSSNGTLATTAKAMAIAMRKLACLYIRGLQMLLAVRSADCACWASA